MTNHVADEIPEFYTSLGPDGVCIEEFSGIEKVYCLMSLRKRLDDKPPSIGMKLYLADFAAKQILAECALCPEIRRIPAIFCLGDVSRPLKDAYWLWWSTTQHYVLDERAARIRYYKRQVLTVDEWALDRDLIPPLDLFLTTTNKWIASERLVEVVQKNEFSGFGFKALTVEG